MSDWNVFLDTCGAQRDGVQVTDFGDPQGELAAANEAIRVDLSHLGLLRVGGGRCTELSSGAVQ